MTDAAPPRTDAAGHRRSGYSGGSGKAAILVAHGSLANGLVSAMEKVLGPQPNVLALSNTGKAPAALEAEITAVVAGLPAGTDVYLLSDLQGGSCGTVCVRAARRSGVRAVFYGVNLTLLLEFVLHQHLPPAAFFDAIVAKARNAVSGVEVESAAAGTA